jgi:ABC-type branched-subunit amino acid transport system ATPase component
MNPTLLVEGLSGGYERVRVFRDVDLTIAPRETVGILGPNGAGRTTLLLTLIGILPALSGRIKLDGADVTTMPAYRRARSGIGHVPEGRQILSTLTVEANLELVRAAKPRGESKEKFKQRMGEVFELFPRLKERLSQLGGTLSGGEQQMLAIARALLVNPKLLMLDEPTQGLAPVIVRELEGALLQLKGRFSMIIVEQNRTFLDAVSDRLLRMSAGHCTDGPIQERSIGPDVR